MAQQFCKQFCMAMVGWQPSGPARLGDRDSLLVVAALVAVGGHILVACWVSLDANSMWSVACWVSCDTNSVWRVMEAAVWQQFRSICFFSSFLFFSFLFFFTFVCLERF